MNKQGRLKHHFSDGLLSSIGLLNQSNCHIRIFGCNGLNHCIAAKPQHRACADRMFFSLIQRHVKASFSNGKNQRFKTRMIVRLNLLPFLHVFLNNYVIFAAENLTVFGRNLSQRRGRNSNGKQNGQRLLQNSTFYRPQTRIYWNFIYSTL